MEMQALLKAAIAHVNVTLGEAAVIGDWPGRGLPYYLLDRYAFSLAEILGRRCLLCLDRGPEQTPATIKSHFKVLHGTFGDNIIYVTNEMRAYNRKRLIEHRVPFIVPGRQVYLPELGIDLREQFTREPSANSSLGAVAQVLVLREVFHRDVAERQLGEWARIFDYSAMSLSRAADELTAANLAERARKGRSHHIRFIETGRALWDQARPKLRSPIRKVVWVERLALRYGAPLAGESALAEYTMLSAPRVKTIAVYDRDKQLREQLTEVPAGAIAEADQKVELWRYDPHLIREGHLVDELSLWLSLQGQGDERVQIAADELLQGVSW